MAFPSLPTPAARSWVWHRENKLLPHPSGKWPGCCGLRSKADKATGAELRLLQISFYTKNSTRKIQTRVPQRSFYSAKGISLSLPYPKAIYPTPPAARRAQPRTWQPQGALCSQLSPTQLSASSFILVQARTQNPTASTLLHAHSTSLHLS